MLDEDVLVDVVHSLLDPEIFGAPVNILEVLLDPRVVCGMPDKDEFALRVVVDVTVLVVVALLVAVALLVVVALSVVSARLVDVAVLGLLVLVVSAAVAVVIPRGVDVVRGGGVLVWDSPRREGVLPPGDIWENWNVPLVPTDV